MHGSNVPVLIAGAGPAGLSAAVFLGRHGIPSVVLEKRDGLSVLPRAPGLQARTMELFRAAGLGRDIRALEIGDSHSFFEGGILRVGTYTGIAEAEVLEAPSLDGPDISPERVMGCGQDRYEAVLADKARGLGAELRFGCRVRSVSQHGDGVTAVVEDAAAGETSQLRASYLIGADGASSTVRDALGIGRSGQGTVFNAVSIYFRAPELDGILAGRPFIICYATAGGLALSRLHGRDPWLAACAYRPERGESPADFTDERCIQLIRTASGRPGMDVQILARVPWEGSQLVADQFRAGRVFLAGDAAHVHPPAGGFGANSGIHDAHNLAWKLAASLGGWAGDGLLDTYHDERHAVGSAMARQAMVRHRIRSGTATDQFRAEMVDDIVITLGYRYDSQAVITEEHRPVMTGPLRLRGEPGTRVPHVWLERNGTRLSTIDLCWDGFVLLTGPEGAPWQDAAARLAATTGVPLRALRIGEGADYRTPGGDWAAACGICPDGAILIRPDAFVAWRSAASQPEPYELLSGVLARVADASAASSRTSRDGSG